MRGKLRDKHATSKHDVFKHEVLDRKRPGKHNARLALWLNPELDEQDDELLEEGAGEQEATPGVPAQPQPPKAK